MDITNKVALVTGGASGLGLATVKALRAAGGTVVIADLPSSVVTRQVANGVAVRMAVLFLLLGSEPDA